MTVVGSGPDARAGASTDSFDVCVVAWSDPGAATVERLQELFGIAPAMALRLVSDVPVLVKRGASLSDAEAFVQALEAIGAAVVIERSSAGAPQRSAVPAESPPSAAAERVGPPASLPRPPPRRQPQSGPVPRPPSQAVQPPLPSLPIASQVPTRSRAPSYPVLADEGLDILGNDGARVQSFSSRPGRTRVFDDTAEPSEQRRAVARRGQRNLDFAPPIAAPQVDLAANPYVEAVGPTLLSDPPLPSRSQSTDARPNPSLGARPSPRPGSKTGATDPAVSATVGAAPGSTPQRGPRPPAAPTRAKDKAWIVVFGRLAASLLVLTAGLFIDDTILRGNATLPSLLLHAVAIYHLGLGVRGALR